MNATVELDNVSSMTSIPAEASFQRWARAALAAAGDGAGKAANLGIRVVDEAESTALNSQYRDKAYPTNVLSFGSDIPEFALADLDEIPIGDLAICAVVVEREAAEQRKPPEAHWAHMVVHGVLHLKGFDHETEAQASVMEALERRIMQSLGFDDPYAGEFDDHSPDHAAEDGRPDGGEPGPGNNESITPTEEEKSA